MQIFDKLIVLKVKLFDLQNHSYLKNFLMITREEFAIMQQQMVDMNNEKLNLIAQIDSLKQSITQIDIINKMIRDSKQSMEKENASFKEEEGKILSKINDQKKNIEDPNKLKTWDAKKLARLEGTIQELISTSANQDNMIKELSNQIKEYQSKQSEIYEKIKKVHKYCKNSASIIKKIESFGAIQLKVSEYESKLYAINHVRKKNKKRISNLNLSKENIEKTNDVLQEKYNNLDQNLKEVLDSINSIEPNSEQLSTELSDLQNKKANIQEEIEKLEEEEQKRINEFTEILKNETDKENALHDTLNKKSEQTLLLKQSIDQFSIGNSILINKKISLIKQLNQSISGKIKDITKSRSSSPHVLRLVDQQEKEWVEKQQLYEVYNKVEAKHKELTDLVSRKSIIASELKEFMKTVPRLDQKTSSNPLAMLDNAYQMALEENRARAENIADISKDLKDAEEENRKLKRNI